MAVEGNGMMTPGVLNALNRNRKREICDACGFPMPIYPGRYPSACPNCGKSRMLEKKQTA